MTKKAQTTFILGAGASFHAGYPFIRTMGADLLAWMRQPRESSYYDFAQSADFLENRFGNHIETLFNGVQAEINARQPGYSIFANVHKPCLVEAVRHWFADIHLNHEAKAYDSFQSTGGKNLGGDGLGEQPQKYPLTPSCTIRGCVPVRMLVICPKLVLLILAFGVPKVTRLVRLKASPRTSTR